MSKLTFRAALVCAAVLAGCTRDYSLPDPPELGTVKGELGLADGSALGGVPVQLAPVDGDAASQTSDATSGAFNFVDLPPGLYTLRIAPAGYYEVQRIVSVRSGTAKDLGRIVLTPLAQPGAKDGFLTGKVQVNGGGDVTGAEVEIIVEGTQQAVTKLAVGGSGEFTQRLAPNTYQLKVTHPFYVSPPPRTGVVLADNQMLDLRPQPLLLDLNPARIRGRVMKERDLSASRIEAQGAVVSSDTGATATADSAGNFDLQGLPAGMRSLTVTLAGFHDSAPLRLVMVAPAETKMVGDVELLLDRGDLSGEVSMKDNTPLQNVTASLDIVASLDGGALDGGSANPYSAAVAPSSSDPTRGAFVITRVPVGRFSVKVSRENYITANSAPVDVAKDRTTSVGQLDLVRIQGQFNIDDGDATNTPGFTRRTFVTLQLAGASNASEYRVSETDPTLSSVAFQPFGALPDGGTVTPGAIPFTLSSGDGTKTIYLQYKDSSSNVSGVLVANVVLDTVAPSQESLVLEDGHDFTRSSFALLASVFAVDLRGTGVDNASGVGYVKLSGSSALGPDGQLIAQRDPYTPTLSFTRSTTQDGPQTVYAQFIDNAGNASAVVSDDVTVDTVPPSGSMTIARGPKATLDGVTNTPLVDLQFAAAAEPDGGYVQVKLANENGADLSGAVLQRVRSTVAWFIDPTEGNRTVHYVLVDAAGNAAGQAQQQIRYDTTAPSGTLLLTTPNPTSSLSAGLSLSATDFGSNPLSPDAGLTLSEDPTFSTAATVGPMPFVSTRAFTFSPGDGPKTVYARFRDAAGNDSTSSLTVTVDQTAPLGSISLSGVLADGLSSTTSTAAATVTVNVQQNGASLIFLGNETLADCTTAGPYQPLTGTTLSAVPLTGAASPRQVRACLKDAAGNVTGPSGALTATISLDTTAPSGCSLALQGYARGGAPAPAGRTALADITATVSGCIETPTEMFLTNSAVTCTPTVAATWVPFSASRVHTLTGADGTTTVRGCVRDAAHNTSALNAVPITLDTTPPTLSPTVTLDLGAAYVNAAQVTSRGGNIASLSAVVSGATEWSFSETNPPPAAGFVAYTGAAVNVTFAGTGPRTVYAQFRDDVNNVSLVVSDSIEIDVTAPTGAGGLGSPSFTLVGALADGTASSVTTATTAVSLQLNVEGATEYFLGNESLVSCPASGYLPLTGTTLAGQTLSGAATPRQMRACFRDAAGNVAGPITDTIALDGTAPSGCALTVNGFKRDGSAAPADRTALFAVTVAVAGCAETPTEIYLTESTPVCSATVSLPWGTYAASVPFVLSGNDGTHTVRGCVRDAAGNVSTVTADATVLDTTGPSGVSVSINGNAAWLNKSQVTAGSSTLSVSAAAAGATDWAIAETQNPTNWLDLAANNPRPLAVPVTADGLKRVYAVFRDDLQNTSVQVEDTITADITPPTGLNATGNPSIVVSGTLGDGTSSSTISATPNVTVNASVEGATEYFISNESLSSCPASGYLALGSTALPYTLSGATSPRTVRVCFRDAAGNAAPYAQGTLALDTTTATGCTLSAVGYKRDFSPAPAGKTAYNDTRVSVAGCSETPVEVFLTETPVACVSSASFVWQAFSPPVGFTLSSGDGLKTIRGCVRDAAGNVGSVTSADLTLDTTGPSALSVVVNGGATWVNASQLSGGSTTLSIQGNASGAFDWAADETSSPSNFLPIATNPRALSIPVVSDGTRTIRAVFRDDLQNPSATVPETSIRIDTTPPAVTTATLSIVTNGPVADFTNSPAVTLAVTYPSDATETLLAEHAGAGTCAVGDFALSPSQSVVSTYAFTLSPADGPKRVCMYFKDAAGNASGIISDTAVLDRTPPTTPQIINADQYTRDSNLTGFSVQIEAPSVDQYFYTYEKLGGLFPDGGPITSWTATTPVGPTRFIFYEANDGGETGVRNEFKLRAKDDAGNVSGESAVVVIADTNPPDPVTSRPEWIDNGNQKGTLYWLDPSTGAVPDLAFYNVYYGSSPSFADSEAAAFANEGVSPVRISPRKNTTLSGLPNGSTTYVRVRGVDLAGNVGDWLPDAGTLPLKLQPSEVSPNEVAVLSPPAGSGRVIRMTRQGNVLYALAASTACSATSSSQFAVHAINMAELMSPVQKGQARNTWTQPSIAATATLSESMTCLSDGANGDIVSEGHWLFVLTPGHLRIFEMNQPAAFSAPTVDLDLTGASPIEAGARALDMHLIGDKLALVGRRSAGGTWVAVLNLADLYDASAATVVDANDFVATAPPPRALLMGPLFFAQPTASILTRDRLLILAKDPASTTTATYIVSLAPSLTGTAIPQSQGTVFNTGYAALSRGVASGSLAYFTSPSFGLTTFDLSSGSGPWNGMGTTLNPATTTAYLGSGQYDVAGNQLYLPEDGNGLRVIDLAQASFPRDIGFYSTPAPSNVLTFGNYGVISLSNQLRFMELATARGLRTFTSEPAAGHHPTVVGSFLYGGMGYLFDLQAGLGVTRPAGITLPAAACALGSTASDEVELTAMGTGFRVFNLESGTDRIATTINYSTTDVTLAGASGRVTDLELFGNHLIVAEVRTTGVWLEVYRAGKARNRSGVAINPATDLVGSVQVAAIASPPSTLIANLGVGQSGRVGVGLETNGASPGGAGRGDNLYFVELNPLLDDVAGGAAVVHGPVNLSSAAPFGAEPVTDLAIQGPWAYVSTLNGVYAVDISVVMNSSADTFPAAPGTPLFGSALVGNAFDGVYAMGSNLLVTPGERSGVQTYEEGVYAIDISIPNQPDVQAFLPAIHGNNTCSPLGDSTRRMRSRLTVAGSRAYLNIMGTVRVIDLE